MRPITACLVLALAAGHAAYPRDARAADPAPSAPPATVPDRAVEGDPQPLSPAEARALFDEALQALDGTNTWRLSTHVRGSGETRVLRRDARGHLVAERQGVEVPWRVLHIGDEAWTQVDGGAWQPDPDAAAGREAMERQALANGPALRALALQADAALVVRDLGPAIRRMDGCPQRLLAVGEPGPQPPLGRLELTVCVDDRQPGVAEWIAPASGEAPLGVATYYFHVDIVPLRAPGDRAGPATSPDAVREPDAIAALARAVDALRGAGRLEVASMAPMVPGTAPQPVRLRWQRDGVAQLEFAVMGQPAQVHREGGIAWIRQDASPWIPLDQAQTASLGLDAILADLWVDADAAQATIDSAADVRLAAGAAPGTLRIVLAGLPQPPVDPGQPPEAPERIVVVLDAATHALREVIQTYGGEGLPPREYRTEHRPPTFEALSRE